MKRPYFDEFERQLMRNDESFSGALMNFKLHWMQMWKHFINVFRNWRSIK